MILILPPSIAISAVRRFVDVPVDRAYPGGGQDGFVKPRPSTTGHTITACRSAHRRSWLLGDNVSLAKDSLGHLFRCLNDGQSTVIRV